MRLAAGPTGVVDPESIPTRKFGSGDPHTQSGQDDQGIVTGCDEIKAGEPIPAAMSQLAHDTIHQEPEPSGIRGGGGSGGGGSSGVTSGVERTEGEPRVGGTGSAWRAEGEAPQVAANEVEMQAQRDGEGSGSGGGESSGQVPDGAAAATNGYGGAEL